MMHILFIPTARIVGSYKSDLKYKDSSCEELATEISNLARRENQLIVAQKQRIKTNKMQAFWLGYGVEAS